MDALTRTVESYRQNLASVWSDSTANPRSRPLPEEMPTSFGHCEVASAVIFGLLVKNFKEAQWRLAYGRLLAVREDVGKAVLRPMIAEHIWVDYRRVKLIDATVIDITGDQANHRALGPAVVETYDALSEQGIIYQPRSFYADLDDFSCFMAQFDCNFATRFKDLQERFDQSVSQ